MGDDDTQQASFTVLDRGVQKLAKICVVCNRPFTWRKKWERCWDEVQTCSDGCKRERKRRIVQSKKAGKEEESHHLNDDESKEIADAKNEVLCAKERCQEDNDGTDNVLNDAGLIEDPINTSPSSKNKADGKNGTAERMKICANCKSSVELAYRIRYDKSLEWRFVCRECWPILSGQDYLEQKDRTKKKKSCLDLSQERDVETPEVTGGPGNPHYQYGGTWKATTGETKGEIEKNKKKREKNTKKMRNRDEET